jgi:hypothetical protein
VPFHDPGFGGSGGLAACTGFGGGFLFLFEGFADRIDLRRIRLFLDLLRLFLRLLDDLSAGRVSSRPAFPRPSAGGGAVSVTTGAFSVILPTASRPAWLRRLFSASGFGFLLAGLHAGHDLGKLVGRNHIDRHRIFRRNFRALVENDSITHPSTNTCRATDARPSCRP